MECFFPSVRCRLSLIPKVELAVNTFGPMSDTNMLLVIGFVLFLVWLVELG